MVRKGLKEWTTVAMETHIKKRLQNYKKRKRYHSDGETIERLLDEADK